MRRVYGAGVVHLLAVLGCLALAGAAVVHVAGLPSALRIGAWALGAVLLHDLVLFPLYAGADRLATSALPRDAVGYVRVPTVLSGLLLLLFWPLVTRHSEGSFSYASGRTEDVFLVRYLVVVAVLYLGSALLFLLARRRHR